MHYLLCSEKKTNIITRLALLFAIITAGLALFCFFALQSSLIWHRAPTGILISDENRIPILDDRGRISYSPQKSEVYLVKNTSDKEAELFLSDKSFILSPFEEKELSDVELSFIKLATKEKTTFFVSNEDELEKALNTFSEGIKKDVVFLCDIETKEQIEFSDSCRIDMESFSLYGEGLHLASASKESIVILSKKEKALFLQCDAPQSELYVSKNALTTEKELYDFYIKTESFNGSRVDIKNYPVKDFEMLSALSKKELPEDSKITVLESFDIEEDLSFPFICNLSFEKELNFNSHSLKFISQARTAVDIVTKEKQDNSKLIFLCPKTDINWSGKAVPDAQSVCERSKLNTLNGTDLSQFVLGGDAQNKILSFKVRHENLTRPIEYVLQGNVLVGTLDYLDNYYDLENASVEITLDSGKYHFKAENVNSDSTVDLTKHTILTLTDEENKQSKYLVKTIREYKSLPVVEILTEDRLPVEDRKEYINAVFSLNGNNSGLASLEETAVQIRGRGNSTWDWEKKPYKLKFNEDISLFGLSASNEWALLANYADKSLIRNRLAYEMGKLLSFEYTPTQYAVDVFFNGEYQGVYTFGEHLEAAKGRVELDQSYNAKDSGYLIEVGGVDSSIHKLGVDYFHAGSIRFALVKSPGKGDLTSTQFDYVSRLLQNADRAVTNQKDWRQYLDEKTLIDWILIMELTNNTDGAFRRSCYYTKNADTLLMMGPIWDFDLAFGNFNRDDSNYDSWATTTDDDYVGVTWTAHLLQDKEFVDAMYQRWQEIKSPLLERANEVIAEASKEVSGSAEENFKKWDTLNIRTTMQRSDVVKYNTYSKQLQYIKDFLEKRASWLDGELERLHNGGKYEIPVIEEEED